MGTCEHPGCSEWNTPTCNKTCQNGDPFTKYKYYAKSAYAISSKVADIQTEIMTNGPVEGIEGREEEGEGKRSPTKIINMVKH
jgi:hypothetical protein